MSFLFRRKKDKPVKNRLKSPQSDFPPPILSSTRYDEVQSLKDSVDHDFKIGEFVQKGAFDNFIMQMTLISYENQELDNRMNMWRDGAETFYKSFENAELHRQFGESLSELLKALKEALSTVAVLNTVLSSSQTTISQEHQNDSSQMMDYYLTIKKTFYNMASTPSCKLEFRTKIPDLVCKKA